MWISYGIWNVFGQNNGAPRPMKMGTIASPWRFDAEACRTPQWVKPREPTISHCAGQSA
jgi:hypothetical protein